MGLTLNQNLTLPSSAIYKSYYTLTMSSKSQAFSWPR